MIENPIHTRRALMAWQRPLDSGKRSDRFAVAELVQNGTCLSFRYLEDQELEPARQVGFTGYPGLPIGSSQLDGIAEEILMRRLPPKKRPDFGEFLRRFGLPSDENYPALTLLAYTGARQTGDGFSVCETFDGFEPPFTYVFDVAGSRHYRGLYNEFNQDDCLRFEREPDNEHDPDTIRIERTDGTTVGYVNRLQTGAVGRWLDNDRISARVFRTNGRIEYPRLFVLADIVPRVESLAA